MFHLYDVSSVVPFTETERKMGLPGAGRRREWELFNGYRVLLFKN
jgi:hypothetical protein